MNTMPPMVLPRALEGTHKSDDALFYGNVPLVESFHGHPREIQGVLNGHRGRDNTDLRNMKEAKSINHCITEMNISFSTYNDVCSFLLSPIYDI